MTTPNSLLSLCALAAVLCLLLVQANCDPADAVSGYLARRHSSRPGRASTSSASFSPPAGRESELPSPPALPSSRRASNVSFVDVYEFGAAGDGVTDNTAAFQSAIDSVFAAGGGVVLANRGYFLFTGSLTVPEGVTLEGTYSTVPSHPMVGASSLPRITGTLLMPTAGKGREDGQPFITLQRDATVRGAVIYYPTQSKAKSVPVPFPWTVDMVSDNAAITDIECLNCWNFIRAVNSGRHYIARIQGQPLNIGVFIDETYDIGRVENVHFNPWYEAEPTFMSWQLAHGRSFVVARSDWEYFFNTFSFGYAIGYHFVESKAGSCNGNFLGIGADMAVNASVQVDGADEWGILITNGEFTSFIDPNFGKSDADSTQVVVSASNTGGLRFVNSAFWGPSHHIARIDGSGSVGFGDCIFSQWDAEKKGKFAIQVNGTGSVLVRGSEFQQDGNQVSLASTVRRAVIVGNLLTGKERLVNDGAKSVQIGLNAADVM